MRVHISVTLEEKVGTLAFYIGLNVGYLYSMGLTELSELEENIYQSLSIQFTLVIFLCIQINIFFSHFITVN